MRIKTIVATNDLKTQTKLEREALFLNNKMEVVSYVRTGDELLRKFEEDQIKVVIIDRELKGRSAIDCIEKIISAHKDCCIVALDDALDNDFLYQLLRVKVQVFLRKPLDMTEFNTELTRISEDIRRVTLESIHYDATIAMQSLYFWKLMFENSDIAHNMKFTNEIMGVHFEEGIFRTMLFRIDQIHGELPQFEKTEYYTELKIIQQYIKAETNRYIYEYCYDMIFDFRFNGVFSVINYDEKYEKIILGMLDELQVKMARFTVLNYGFTVTICVGSGYHDFSNVYRSREEAYSVSWSRRRKGIGKVLIWQKENDWQSSYQQKLQDIVENLKVTADTLNFDDFHKSIKELFSLPDFVLADYKARNYILGFISYFFDVNGSLLSKHMNVEQEKEYMKKALNFSYTLENYRNNLQQKFDSIYKLLSDEVDKQNIRPMRAAIKYIKENYKSTITAETLAGVVNLSPVYFSHLFKKQTNMNMTDFITEYRVEIAKEELMKTDQSVFEIATNVGFQDQRYFSKRFKQIVGMTPTEYRKQR